MKNQFNINHLSDITNQSNINMSVIHISISLINSILAYHSFIHIVIQFIIIHIRINYFNKM
jgi:large-conductance mechanosensitive channel